MLFHLVQQGIASQQIKEIVGVESACVSGHPAVLRASNFMGIVHGSWRPRGPLFGQDLQFARSPAPFIVSKSYKARLVQDGLKEPLNK